jgi:hypothetical protein
MCLSGRSAVKSSFVAGFVFVLYCERGSSGILANFNGTSYKPIKTSAVSEG